MLVNTFSIRIEANLSNLAHIRQYLQEKAEALRVDTAIIPDILLATTEAATNIIVHGYQEKEGTIDIEVTKDRDSLVIRLRDQAPLFDPTNVPSPDVSLPLENRPPGGMGILLTKDAMDEVTYQVTPNGENELTLVKSGCISS
jgi:serine/threonine-protein kinase RsbW